MNHQMNHWISAKTTETETIKRTWPPGYPGQEPATQPAGKVAQAAHGGGQHQGGGRHPGGQEFMTLYQNLTLFVPETKYLNFFLQVAVATSNIVYTVLYFLLTTLAVFLISLGVAFYLVVTQLDDLRHSYFILLISYSTGCSFIPWLCFDYHCVLGCLLLSNYTPKKSPSLKLRLLLFWSPYHVVLGCPAPTPPLLSPVKQAISILYYPRPQ